MEENQFSPRMKQANNIENPLSLISTKEFINKDGKKFNLECKKSCYLDDKERKWCFSLLERNMKQIYQSSKSGWDENEKRDEMFDEKAYYIIASDQSERAAFCHFRFDMDFDNEVIYCYELQVEANYRKSGLGKFIMEILESLCEKLELEKVMLTCSKFNKIGQKFFKEKMRYTRDETDLNEEDPTIDYDILSKVFWEEADDDQEEE